MVTQNVAKDLPHHVTHRPGKFEVASQTVKEMHLKENTFFDIDHRIKVILNIAQQLLYHVSYSHAKF